MRTVAAVLILGIWLVLFAAAVELLAIGEVRRAHQANPYIAAFAANEGIPRPERPLALTALDRAPAEPLLPWLRADPAPPAPSHEAAYRVEPAGTDEEESQWRAREAFQDLTPGDRDVFAALHRVRVLEQDPGGSLREVHGPADLGGPGLTEAVRRAWAAWTHRSRVREAGQAFEEAGRTVVTDIPETGMVIRDSSRPASAHAYGDSNIRAHWFIPVYPRSIKEVLETAPPADSQWKVPWLYFQPGFAEERPEGAGDFIINSRGYRSPEFSVPKPAGTFRILCIGGSTTEEGSRMAATYPSQLAHRLRARFPGKRIEVINAGVSGITSTGHLWKLPEYLSFEPDMVVAYMGINDILLDILPNCPLPGPSVLLRSHALQAWWPIDISPTVDAVASLAEPGLITNMRALTRGAASHGIPLVLCGVAHPDLEVMDADEAAFMDFITRRQWLDPQVGVRRYIEYIQWLNARLEELAAEEGAGYIPVDRHLRGGMELFGDNCHMLDDGIALKAEVIYRYLVGE